MIKKIKLHKVKIHHFLWMLVLVLLAFLTGVLFLYWQKAITAEALAFWILGLVIVGLLFVFGLRVAQKEGFIDGFRNGRDGASG